MTQVDAFTDRPFTGNPAAVCLLSQPKDDAWLQQVAQEMNLSETAFVLPQGDEFQLRWFTPATEVDLCGHATLASAHVLWSEGRLPIDAEARFQTRSGLLTAQRQGDWIELNFPVRPVTEVTAPPALAQSLGVSITQPVYQSALGYLVELDGEATVRQLQPDFALMATLPVHGVIVTSRPDPDSQFDFVSRYFAPNVGINEDPVTGSAHCVLAPYWSERLSRDGEGGLHKTEFLASQVSARGGVMKVRLVGDRVVLGGQAVTVLRGEWLA